MEANRDMVRSCPDFADRSRGEEPPLNSQWMGTGLHLSLRFERRL